jgi:hypothetical protein
MAGKDGMGGEVHEGRVGKHGLGVLPAPPDRLVFAGAHSATATWSAAPTAASWRARRRMGWFSRPERRTVLGVAPVSSPS